MKLVICGGGISGISAAFYAKKLFKNGCRVILIEKNNRLGGWMDTNVSNGNRNEYRGPINEKGPRGVRTNTIAGQISLSFISEFGFWDEIIPVKASHEASQSRMLYVNERLYKLPNSLISCLQKKPPFSKSLAAILVPGLIKTIPSDLETVSEVIEARFGKEFSDIAAGALCRGVFAGDYKQLSLKAAFNPVWKSLGTRKAADLPRKPSLNVESLVKYRNSIEQHKEGLEHLNVESLVKYRNSIEQHKEGLEHMVASKDWVQWGAKKGFSGLIEDMAEKLETEMGVEIMRECEVESLLREDNGKFSLELKDNNQTGTIDDVDHVISALPSHTLSKILSQSKENAKTADSDKLIFSDLIEDLDKINWVDVALANVEFPGLPRENLPYLGFGHLVPPCEPSDLLGVVYDSCAFPSHDRLGSESTRLTCMMGGSWFDEVFGADENIATSKIEQTALDGLDEQLDLYEDPVTINSHVCRKCIPLYRRGHTDVVEDLEDLIDDNDLEVSLVGASYWGVGITDCIMNSRIAVQDLVERFDST